MITVRECNSRFDLLAGLPDGEPPPGPLDWPPVPPQQHHAGLDHAQTVLCNDNGQLNIFKWVYYQDYLSYIFHDAYLALRRLYSKQVSIFEISIDKVEIIG